MGYFSHLLAVWMLLFCSCSFAESIAVIVNSENAVDDVSKQELSEIYRGLRTRWSDGTKIVLLNRPVDSEERDIFYRAVLHASPNERINKPGTLFPVKTNIQISGVATKRLIGNILGAIGFIRAADVDSSIKCLKVDGKKYDSSEYPIK
ncbi:MAG: substrate-binding domain-containing protein [Chlamydiota bacterium]|nr:substrate-binding domain-containing protein [Chlamydiota bacterium]